MEEEEEGEEKGGDEGSEVEENEEILSKEGAGGVKWLVPKKEVTAVQ